VKTDVTEEAAVVYVFDGYRLEQGKRLLFDRSGDQVSLMPKAFDILSFLTANANRLVEKDELMSAIWPDTVVEENNLTQNISSIRKALGERLGENRFIATIPGRGYKFVADVRKIEPESDIGRDIEESARLDAPRTRSNRSRLLILIGLVALFSAAVSIAAFIWWPKATRFSPAISSIAVLPFKPIALDMRDESLEMGMTDALILKLSDVENLKVRPFTAVRRFSAPDQDALAAGRALGVDAVLDGRLQSADQRIRVTLQLIRVADGQQLWAGQFDEKVTDIFALQDSIAQKVASQLSTTLGRRASKNYTSSVEAYQLYMRGKLHARRLVGPEVQKGIDYFNKAVEADPSFALAYVELSNAHRALVLSSDASPLEQMPKAKGAAIRAVELDPELAEGWAARANCDFWYAWDWDSAQDNYRKAIELNPANGESHLFYAHTLSNIGKHDDALSEVRKAREMEPANLLTNAIEGQILFFAGQRSESEQVLKRTVDLDPNFWLAHLFLSRIYLTDGRFDDAIAEARKAAELSGGSAEANASIAYSMARSGQAESARKILDDLRERSKVRYVPPYAIAQIHLALGEMDSAIAELERAYQSRDALMVFLKVEPKWDDLRDDPRFIGLLQRMKF
jgi:DNA-binding winged helix-turn-helix (wHTH) protein/TolB-like protein